MGQILRCHSACFTILFTEEIISRKDPIMYGAATRKWQWLLHGKSEFTVYLWRPWALGSAPSPLPWVHKALKFLLLMLCTRLGQKKETASSTQPWVMSFSVVGKEREQPPEERSLVQPGVVQARSLLAGTDQHCSILHRLRSNSAMEKNLRLPYSFKPG